MFSSFFVLSVFIPYFQDNESFNYTFGKDELEDYIRSRSKVVCLGINSKHRAVKIIPNTYKALYQAYSEECDFVYITEEYANEISQSLKIDLPVILLYENGRRIATFEYPPQDNAFIRIVQIFLDIHTEIDSFDHFTDVIGSSKYTIITTNDYYDEAKIIHYNLSITLGMIDIILVERQLLDDMRINYPMALYRNEDSKLIGLYGEINEFMNASIPICCKLELADILVEEKTLVVISSNRYSDEMKEILYKVGKMHPSFVFGFLGPRLAAYAEQTLNQRFNRGKNVAIFNWKENFYYNTSTYFTKEYLSRPINSSSFIDKFNSLLNDIEMNILKPMYASESIPETNTTIQKLVGKTYKYYINDREKDVVVLYERADCEHCAEFLPIFANFAKECENEKFIKFGYIDVTKNSFEGRYPFMDGVPHVRIFPMRNKTDDDCLREGFDRTSLIRFINLCGSQKLSIEEPEVDRMKLKQDLLKLVYRSPNYPEIEKEKLKKYLEKVSNSFAKDSTQTTNEFDEL